MAKNGTLGTPQTFAFDLTELKAAAAVATSDVAASAATTPESYPALRNTPSGTSLSKRRLTARRNW